MLSQKPYYTWQMVEKEASLNGLPRFPSVISTKKKNNDYFQFISEGRNLTTLKTDWTVMFLGGPCS